MTGRLGAGHLARTIPREIGELMPSLKQFRPAAASSTPTVWPSAEITSEGFRSGGSFVGGYELEPASLVLMATDERRRALDNIASLYDSIPTRFQLLSIPAARPPEEHLAYVEQSLGEDDVAHEWYKPYAALYEEISATLRQPPRRTFLLLDSPAVIQLRRNLEVVQRTAAEKGIALRELKAEEIAELWATVAREGAAYRVGAPIIEGPSKLVAFTLSRRWPAEVTPGWLAPILGLQGLPVVSMRVEPLSRADAMHFMTKRLRQTRAAARFAAERGEVADVERERLEGTAVEARRNIHAASSRVYMTDTVIMVEGATNEQLEERKQTLMLEGRAQDIEIETALLRMGEAWQSCLPGAPKRPLMSRNLDSRSLAASILHTSSDLYEPTGHLYGRVRSTDAPIVLDRFAHSNYNAIVLGRTGSGKTMATGAEIARCYMRGVQILGVDPLGDYRRIVDALVGTYLELGIGGSGINPFALTASQGHGALGAKIATLTHLIAVMAGGLTRSEESALDRTLRAVYEDAGITANPETHTRRPPTLVAFVERLGEVQGATELAYRLERWTVGSLGPVLAADEPLPPDERVLMIGLAQLAREADRTVAQLAALGLLWDMVRSNLVRKLVVIDEAWKVMRNPDGAAFIEELARSARHYHAGLHIATQDIAEFLNSPSGETIIKQCNIRILLGQEPEGIDALGRYFALTAAERQSLGNVPPGQGLLFAGSSHVAYEVVVNRTEYDALTSRPSDLLAAASAPAVEADEEIEDEVGSAG
jgi:hypothetical protein